MLCKLYFNKVLFFKWTLVQFTYFCDSLAINSWRRKKQLHWPHLKLKWVLHPVLNHTIFLKLFLSPTLFNYFTPSLSSNLQHLIPYSSFSSDNPTSYFTEKTEAIRRELSDSHHHTYPLPVTIMLCLVATFVWLFKLIKIK